MFIAKNKQELKCPNCNGQLSIEDINDTDYNKNSYFEYGWCVCEKCHATFTIEVVYNFAHYKVGKRLYQKGVNNEKV